MLRITGLIAILLLVCCAAVCRAQTPLPDSLKGRPVAKDTAAAPKDSVKTATPQEVRLTKNPTVATLLSLVPGAGQVYNQQYWKAPLFAGAAVFFAWRAVYYHIHFTDKANSIAALPADDPSVPGLKVQREFYRDNRDLNAAYYLGVTLLSMVDAYVGAHLYDFDVSDDVSAGIRFDPFNRQIGLRVKF